MQAFWEKVFGACLVIAALSYFTFAWRADFTGWFGSWKLFTLVGAVLIVGLFPFFPERK